MRVTKAVGQEMVKHLDSYLVSFDLEIRRNKSEIGRLATRNAALKRMRAPIHRLREQIKEKMKAAKE